MREPEEIFGAVALRMTERAKHILERQRDECVSLPDCFDLPASIEVIAIICFVSG